MSGGALSDCGRVATEPLQPALPRILISEFYPCALDGDEYVVLSNPNEEDVDLSGWQLTDGEGYLTFIGSAVAPAGSRVAVSFNASSYAAAYGVQPEIPIDGTSSTGACEVTASFRLGNDGDSLVLRDADGHVIDSVLYGECTDLVTGWTAPAIPAPRMGEVMKRTSNGGMLRDTDTSADWMPFREYRYGYTSFATWSSTVDPGNLTLFTSPDCASDVIRAVIDSAGSTIRLCTYELSSWFVCGLLMDALERGVGVQILVDGSPSGGIGPRGIDVMSVLAKAGASVRVVTGSIDAGVVRHVFALHSKYIVIDGETAVVMSENFVPSGVPTDRVFANRGWGVSAVDRGLSGFLSSVFDEDSRADRPDVSDWLDDDRYEPFASLQETEPGSHLAGMMSPQVVDSAAHITLVVSPDASTDGPFLRRILVPQGNLLVEQFQVDLLWRTRWADIETLSPLLEDVIRTARSGVPSRFLMDSSWFNLERNGEVADSLAAVYSVEALDSQVRLISPSSPITVLHNKGLVVDSRTTVVSSNNWVYASFAKNRELAAIIDSPEVAGYFTTAFDADWYPDTVDPELTVQTEVYVAAGTWVNLSYEKCWDDRMLVDVTWDVHADGTVDASAPVLSFLAAVPGEIEVVITASDAWGNEAAERITVHVTGEPYQLPQTDSPTITLPSAVGVLAAVTVGLWKVWRRVSSWQRAPSRKINDRDGD